MLTGLSPRRRLFVAGLAALALAATAALVVLNRPDSVPRVTGRDDGPLPVVLVHGLGGDPSNMSTIEAALRRRGRRTVSVTLPRNGFADIAESAAVVDRAVRDLGRVDLVGYSLGGVVIRAWIDRHDGAGLARYVVTLGSPHHGARLADTVAALDPTRCVDACAQVRPGSAFLRELNEDETPDGPRFVAIWTSLDQTVTPPVSATLDGATNVRLQDVCPDSQVGHGAIARDPAPVGLTLLALDGEDVSGVDCADARAAGI